MIGWMLSGSAAFGAEVWWVPRADDADALRAALETEWAGLDCQVVVGDRPDAASGWTWDGGRLQVHTADTDRVVDAGEARVAVLLARTWQIRTETPGWEQWLPAGEAVQLAEVEPVEAIRALPDPTRTPWSLGLGMGLRGMSATPVAAPGVSIPAELAVGSWVIGVDATVNPKPWSIGPEAGLVDAVTDAASLTLRSGFRSRGHTWFEVTPGLQYRAAQAVLARNGSVVSSFQVWHAAGVLQGGVGRDLGFVRLEASAWVRTTVNLPVSAGADADLVFFVHERRR